MRRVGGSERDILIGFLHAFLWCICCMYTRFCFGCMYVTAIVIFFLCEKMIIYIYNWDG